MNLSDIELTRSYLAEAEACLISAGAGMGVDSGLPDFRGDDGFWNAYPPYKALGFSFVEMANPARFQEAPELGWGFYGHRLNLYRKTEPHAGFKRLLEYVESLTSGGFVFTSNVDGHFQAAGFSENQVHECHGSIRHFQCFNLCSRDIWPAPTSPIKIDEATMQALDPLPECRNCRGLARPAILMFGDTGWNPHRTLAQSKHYQEWVDEISDKRLVILEFGAGTSVPTVRLESEAITRALSGKLIRVNPREPELPADVEGVSLPMGALEAIGELIQSY